MAEAATYKIVGLAGTSTDSIAEAMRSGVRRAAKTCATMKVGFRLED